MKKVTILFFCIWTILLLWGKQNVHGQPAKKKNIDVTGLYSMSRACEKKGDDQTALEIAKTICRYYPNYASYMRVAWLYRKCLNYKAAQAYYRMALTKVPASFDARLGLLYTQIFLNQFDKARSLAARLEKEAPGQENLENAAKIMAKKENALGWHLFTGLYCLGGTYSDQTYKGNFSGSSIVLRADHAKEFGVLMDLEYAHGDLMTSEEDYSHIAGGCGLYLHPTKDSSLWTHYKYISGNDDAQGHGQILSLFAGKTFGKVETGISMDAGFYDEFNTIQIQPVLSCSLGNNFYFSIAPMFQTNNASLDYSGTATAEGTKRNNNLTSLEIATSLETTGFTGRFSIFKGRRWFTVENSGLFVWNSDDLITSGVRLGLSMKTKYRITPVVNLRYDRVSEQYGIEKNFDIMGISLGLEYKW